MSENFKAGPAINEPPYGNKAAMDRIAALTLENTDLRQMLLEYAQHNAGCSARHGSEYRCRCGWREDAKRLGVEEGPEK